MRIKDLMVSESENKPDDEFYRLIEDFIDRKKNFHKLLDYVNNDPVLREKNDQAKRGLYTVYRGVFASSEDEEEYTAREYLSRVVIDRELKKMRADNAVPYTSTSVSREVAEKFARHIFDWHFLLEFNVGPESILLVTSILLPYVSGDVKSTIEFEKEVIINPTKARLRNASVLVKRR